MGYKQDYKLGCLDQLELFLAAKQLILADTKGPETAEGTQAT